MQVNVNILEAQKLVGVNINPAVFIRVGNQKKHTATQKSTNCPFYNEVQQSGDNSRNFQFEFQETPGILFDKVIEIKVSSTVFLFVCFSTSVSTAVSMVRDLGVAKVNTCYVTSSQVFHRRTLAFLMTHIGTFKIDISTVYNQPGTSAAHTEVL
ncbi:fer-1-like protein 4 [Thunnus thynnus]|uniref:fer-1-like protein 4 n=1 Tax=Thunnus thynnus TaxID=8237 RepID=UPI003528293B